MVKRECPDCGNGFEYTPNPNFADKRKYCDDCGTIRKESWNAKNGKTEAKTSPAQQAPTVRNTPLGAPKREFEAHLSVEQVRTNALTLAKSINPNLNKDLMFAAAEEIEAWLTR